ncbi:MAG: hypothetical protein U0521_04310 [Anaerolineae bacterium]
MSRRNFARQTMLSTTTAMPGRDAPVLAQLLADAGASSSSPAMIGIAAGRLYGSTIAERSSGGIQTQATGVPSG